LRLPPYLGKLNMNEERRVFEEWMEAQQVFSLHRTGSGYSNYTTQCCWEAWQAAVKWRDARHEKLSARRCQ